MWLQEGTVSCHGLSCQQYADEPQLSLSLSNDASTATTNLSECLMELALGRRAAGWTGFQKCLVSPLACWKCFPILLDGDQARAAHAFISSNLYVKLNVQTIHRLYLIRNAAIHLLHGSDHNANIKPVLNSPYWLSVHFHCQFKCLDPNFQRLHQRPNSYLWTTITATVLLRQVMWQWPSMKHVRNRKKLFSVETWLWITTLDQSLNIS